MLAIFSVTFPFFALVAAGYAAARLRLLPIDAIPGLNLFLLYFALPCMLFQFGARTPTAQLLDGAAALVWCVVALTVVGVSVGIARRGIASPRLGWNDAAFGALVAAFPNTGFMGVPLLVALLGSAAAGPVILTIVIDMVLTSSLCIALSRLDGARAGGGTGAVLIAVRKALHGVVLNPMPWAILLGALVSAMQWPIWGPLQRTVAMLGDAASPTALFTIGAVLARPAVLARVAGAAPAARPAPADSDAWRAVLPMVLIKLALHPLLVAVVGWAAVRAGLPLAPGAWAVLVLVAALPSASNVSLLAERFGADNARIARIILWTTLATFFSFPWVADGVMAQLR